MTTQMGWDKTNLEKYLQYEYWEPYKAMYILAGHLLLDSESPDDFGMPTEKEEEDYCHLKDIWVTKGLSNFYSDPHSPSHYIEWAISKKYRPAWLNWAIEHGLYTPKQDEKKPSQTVSASKVEMSNLVYWRTILYANIQQFDNAAPNGKAEVRRIIKNMKELKDKRIPNKGSIEELVWIDDIGNEQTVTKKTVSTAISKARKFPI